MKTKGSLIIFVILSLTFCLTPLIAKAGNSPSPFIDNSIKNDTSAPLWSIRPIMTETLVGPVREIPMFNITEKLPYFPENMKNIGGSTDPLIQDWPIPSGLVIMPGTIKNFEGLNNVNGVLPPDTNGDVGPNHYVQMINMSFQIWDKNGVSLYGPANNNTLWTGFGGPCETTNNGDPIVLYDEIADRWLMSQFALPNYPSGPFYECIAISQTSDPTGAWYRYAFRVHSTKLNDYPKFGVWPDAYYMSVNQFDTGGWAGAGVFAFNRSKMIAGRPANFVYFDLFPVDPNIGGMLPSDLDGPTLPPSGAPNYFVAFDDDAWGYPQDQLEIWQFHVDWAAPANSTFTGPTVLTTAPFDSNMCGYSRDCIPQPGVGITAYVDAISDRLMNRLQYRNFGSYEALVTNHTVDAGADHAGIRWYELNKTASWSIYQQGTYAPDSEHRWMGSIAMDKQGNIALGYSVSSGSLYPSIRYTGRLAGDPLNTLPQGEATLIAGAGSQTHTASRWGDYSMMAVDPADDCTFWYTQEYYAATSSVWWQSRIGSFKFPSCISVPALGPDLIVTQVDGPLSGVRGGRIPISFTIKNQGDLSTAIGTGISFYLSADTTITTGDIPLGSMFVNALAPGTSVTKIKSGLIKAKTPVGNYYIGAIVDPQNNITESDEGNNTGYDTGQITINSLNW